MSQPAPSLFSDRRCSPSKIAYVKRRSSVAFHRGGSSPRASCPPAIQPKRRRRSTHNSSERAIQTRSLHQGTRVQAQSRPSPDGKIISGVRRSLAEGLRPSPALEKGLDPSTSTSRLQLVSDCCRSRILRPGSPHPGVSQPERQHAGFVCTLKLLSERVPESFLRPIPPGRATSHLYNPSSRSLRYL